MRDGHQRIPVFERLFPTSEGCPHNPRLLGNTPVICAALEHPEGTIANFSLPLKFDENGRIKG